MSRRHPKPRPAHDPPVAVTRHLSPGQSCDWRPSPLSQGLSQVVTIRHRTVLRGHTSRAHRPAPSGSGSRGFASARRTRSPTQPPRRSRCRPVPRKNFRKQPPAPRSARRSVRAGAGRPLSTPGHSPHRRGGLSYRDRAAHRALPRDRIRDRRSALIHSNHQSWWLLILGNT